MIYRLLVFTLLFVCSCKSPKKEVSVAHDKKNKPGKDLTITRETPQINDPLTIEGAMIDHDTLILSLSYSGGCELHHIELQSTGIIAKSLPPQITLTVVHQANNDQCRNLIRVTEKFNIEKLSKIYQQKMVVRLSDYTKPLLYQSSKTIR